MFHLIHPFSPYNPCGLIPLVYRSIATRQGQGPVGVAIAILGRVDDGAVGVPNADAETIGRICISKAVLSVDHGGLKENWILAVDQTLTAVSGVAADDDQDVILIGI